MCTENNATEKNCATVAWTVNGHSIKDYQIVYGDNDKDIGANISAFQQQLSEKTGYLLNAGLDTDMPKSKYEIIIGKTNRSESDAVKKPSALNYVVKVVDDKLVFKYGGIHTREVIITKLVELLTDGQDTVEMNDSYELLGSLCDDQYDSSLAVDADVRVMSANLMAERRGWAPEAVEAGFEFERRAEIFFSALEYYAPDVVGVQEACIRWRNSIKNYERYDERWELLEYDNPKALDDPDNKVYSTVMFRKDIYELVDTGMHSYVNFNNHRAQFYTWVNLKNKQTGKEFCFVSTHLMQDNDLEISNAQADELIEFINSQKLPVFVVGDFNKPERSEVFKRMLAETDSVDSMHSAKERVNNATSGHDWGWPLPWSVSIDHIMAQPEKCDVLKFETCMYNEQIWSSDHSWLLCDFKLK